MEKLDSIINGLELAKKIGRKGGEYWMGRDIQQLLGYANWNNFQKVIEKARMSCESAGIDPKNQFFDTKKLVEAGSGTMVEKGDYFLSRYACYLIAMNGDTTKPEIGIAQAYFAVQTRRQEQLDKLTDQERRIQLRERVRDEETEILVVPLKRLVYNDMPYFTMQDTEVFMIWDCLK